MREPSVLEEFFSKTISPSIFVMLMLKFEITDGGNCSVTKLPAGFGKSESDSAVGEVGDEVGMLSTISTLTIVFSADIF